MDPSLQELVEIRKRISQILAEVSKEQQELDEIIQFINRIQQLDLGQMSNSASSARRKRSRVQVKSVQEEKDDYERRRTEKEINVGRMLETIHQLQEREKELAES